MALLPLKLVHCLLLGWPKFDKNWKPFLLDISTTKPTNHRMRTTRYGFYVVSPLPFFFSETFCNSNNFLDMTLVCEDAVINKTLGFHDNFLFNSLGRLSGSNKLSDVPWSLMASKLSPNWKPLGLVISTTWPINHRKGTKIEYWHLVLIFNCPKWRVCGYDFVCLFVYPYWLLMMILSGFPCVHLFHHWPPLPNLVLLLSSNFFSRRHPTIP